MDDRCPECKTPLLAGATKCLCGWEQKTPQGGAKCLCGKIARINYQGFKCWDCYYQAIHNTENENWRDKIVRDNIETLELIPQPGEPEWPVNKRARKMFREMGGLGEIG